MQKKHFKLSLERKPLRQKAKARDTTNSSTAYFNQSSFPCPSEKQKFLPNASQCVVSPKLGKEEKNLIN